jgi:signal transduction histidine kinase
VARFSSASRALVAVAIGTTVAAVVLALRETADPGVDAWTAGAAGFRLWALTALLPVVVIAVVVHLRRPDHRLGLWFALCAALLGASTSAGLWLHGGIDVPLRHSVAIAGAALDVATIVAVTALLATFPTGRAGRLVEPVLVGAGSAFALVAAVTALGSRVHVVPAPTPPWSPLQVPSLTFLGSAGEALLALAAVVPLAGVVALLWRRSGMSNEERMHVRWVALAGVTALAAIATIHLIRRLGIVELGDGFYAVAPRVVGWLLIASAVAITTLRPGVADAAAPVRRVAVGAALLVTLGLAGGLAWFAAGASTGTSLPGARALAAGLTVAALFLPARAAFERLADRWLFSDAIGDAELLSEFGHRAERAADLDELADLVAATAQRGLRVSWAKASLRGSGDVELGPVGEAGVVRDRRDAAAATIDLANAGDTVGVLECGPKRRGAFTEHDEKLLTALAREAALGVQNARQASELARRLVEIRQQAEELAASRTRIVQAQEAERRRIERNIHDGAQQELAALIAKLRLAQNQLARSPETAARTIEEAQLDVRRALEDLRALARGIHPAVLSDRGLLDAIEASLTRLPLEVVIDTEPAIRGQRFPDDIEAAAYFVTSEALANVLKYAAATRVEVMIRVQRERLEVRVTDNGIGFDPRTVEGTGLANLADRAAALGGELRVESREGAGTTLSLSLPIALGAST